MSKIYHIVKAGNHWAVKNNGLTLSGHNTQKEAIESGKMIAKLTNGELSIHGKNGRIREKNSYSSNPFLKG
ncbi:MAG: DUF2188 domain-containing protein [Bdellovibrionaceae bacterium]|nr:DUF2188 domain-containing protein [Pseudobdellovibrionaceae bacterium]